ncbi:class I SAM-dependent methyltransferase [Alkalimonas collagenimarina]|uniref:Ribosomal RNA small subunit methyltransferase J n=1 Tax=Alkalimonas collagenimarina TaxID=400390 RepID=A0ABT9H105_9GAMM|nr:class I SAM-dependent methyltransferase [Alkalimonas collagenimarina]MDP4536997.1 class I SAM-dependent methyltransferase [Alkalimonas collagenimarina]
MIVLPAIAQNAVDQAYLESLSQRFALPLGDKAVGWYLSWHEERLVLRHTELIKQSDILVDFASGSSSYRRQHGGGKSEAIAKAVGLHKKRDLTVLDATAGLGRDGFVLASIGADVTLVERNPMVAALLVDGLRRAGLDPGLSEWLPDRMRLRFSSALDALQQSESVDVVYLDPMFPERQKSALVKKEMRAFHDVVGEDPDADQLLEPALALATKRVVVKRPAYAEHLAGTKPSHMVKGKNNRFDVYINAAL